MGKSPRPSLNFSREMMSDVMYPTVLLFLSRPADSTNNVTFNELGLSAINNGESKWLPRLALRQEESIASAR